MSKSGGASGGLTGLCQVGSRGVGTRGQNLYEIFMSWQRKPIDNADPQAHYECTRHRR